MPSKKKTITKPKIKKTVAKNHPDTILKQYVHTRQGKRCGLLVGTKRKKIVVGFSKCNLKLDRWDRDLANKIALDRMNKGSKEKIPHSMKHNYDYFMDRLHRYFKV